MYFVYILRCGDQSLYTGVTNDLKRRLAQHKDGKGGHYTRSRGALTFVHTERHLDRSSASKCEADTALG